MLIRMPIDRKRCFGLRDEWYQCMKNNTADLLLYNSHGLKCPLRGECEKIEYSRAIVECQTIQDQMLEPCFKPWIKFYNDRFIYRQGQERFDLSAKIENQLRKGDPTRPKINLHNMEDLGSDGSGPRNA